VAPSRGRTHGNGAGGSRPATSGVGSSSLATADQVDATTASPIDPSADIGAAHYVATSGRAQTTNPPQERESERSEKRGVRPTPVILVSIGQFLPFSFAFSLTAATVPDTARPVDPSAFGTRVGFTARPNPTPFLCFHTSRSCLEDIDPITSAGGKFSKHHPETPSGGFTDQANVGRQRGVWNLGRIPACRQEKPHRMRILLRITSPLSVSSSSLLPSTSGGSGTRQSRATTSATTIGFS